MIRKYLFSYSYFYSNSRFRIIFFVLIFLINSPNVADVARAFGRSQEKPQLINFNCGIKRMGYEENKNLEKVVLTNWGGIGFTYATGIQK